MPVSASVQNGQADSSQRVQQVNAAETAQQAVGTLHHYLLEPTSNLGAPPGMRGCSEGAFASGSTLTAVR